MSNEMEAGHNKPQEEINLLVIDDDMIQRTIISKIGTQAGFKVTNVASYQAAVDMLTSRKFDCITLDLSLGEQSGALLLRTIVETGNSVPVVIISGAEDHVLQTTVKIAKSVGLDTTPFKKPLNLVEVRQTLSRKRQGASDRRAFSKSQRDPVA